MLIYTVWTTGVQTVVMNVIVTHESISESYDSVLVGTGKQKGLESLSENHEWRRRCDVERQVVPDGGTRNRKRPLADCRETNWRNFQTSSGCHVGNTNETRLQVGRRGAVDGSNKQCSAQSAGLAKFRCVVETQDLFEMFIQLKISVPSLFDGKAFTLIVCMVGLPLTNE